MYKSNSFDFNILLIPKKLKTFETNFDDIIRYSGNEIGLHFSILKRNNGLIELINYDFITNDSGYVTANYRYDSLDDQNNQLQKEFINKNCSYKSFIVSFNFNELFNRKYKINRIKRNSKETKLNKIRGNSLLEAYLCFDKYFENIDDNETPLLELLENLEKNKTK